MIRALVGRILGLPRGPFEVQRSEDWVAMPDGVRLHHLRVGPRDRSLPAAGATLLLRTPYEAANRAMLAMARWLAEHGYHVVVQEVRGRYASEGRFVPFEAEGRDGGAMLDWLAEQSWCDAERIAVAGPSYMGIAAWAALGARPERVRALVSILASRDLYDNFYGLGGVFSLANSFEWATWIGEHTPVPDDQCDVARGMAHLPLRDGDRVANREIPYYREWLDHPRRDAYWDGLTPPLPDPDQHPFPPTLVIGGWYDFFQKPALRDYQRLVARGIEPQLIVGPWSHGRAAHRQWRAREAWLLPEVLREMLRFLNRELAPPGSSPPQARARVRYFDLGERSWKRSYAWPDGDLEARFRLRVPSGGGRRGQLTNEEDAGDEPSRELRLRSNPFDPVPSLGGARFAGLGGAVDQRPAEARADVACFTSEVQQAPLRIAGAVRCRIHVRSEAPDLDVHARLVLVQPDGTALNLCDGVSRARWRDAEDRDCEPHWLEPGEITAIEVDLGTIACTVKPAHRLRLEITGTSFPRFERNPGTRVESALAGPDDVQVIEWSIASDAAHWSSLALDVRS